MSRIAENTSSAANAITRVCVSNALRRISVNDPGPTELKPGTHTKSFQRVSIFEHGGWKSDDLVKLAAALKGNSHLETLDLSHGPRTGSIHEDVLGLEALSLSWTSLHKLAAVIPQCALREVHIGKREKDLLNAVCWPKKVNHLATAKSLETQRPFQRLLLAALYTHTKAALSIDVVLCIVARLKRSKQCPLAHAGTRSEAVQPFLWHCSQTRRVARWDASDIIIPRVAAKEAATTRSYRSTSDSSESNDDNLKPPKRQKTTCTGEQGTPL